VLKNKGFLYGLGLGLILGASLLQLMNFAVFGNRTITNDLPTASPSPSSSPSPSASPISSPAPVKTIKPTETTANPSKPDVPSASVPTATKAVEPSVPAVAEPVNNVITIEKGMTSSEVADLFYNKGIIPDRKSFDDALSELKLDRVIRAGTYTFLPKEKNSEIIDKITIRR
jgi:hypothetical protein